MPGGSAGNRYTPESLVLVVVATPVLLCSTITVALAIGAPLGSVTVPDNDASVLCAQAGIPASIPIHRTAGNSLRCISHSFLGRCEIRSSISQLEREGLEVLNPPQSGQAAVKLRRSPRSRASLRNNS